jgi:anti-sigma B factor antagonist
MAADFAFSIASSEDDGRVLLVPRGELDLATAPELERVLLERLEEGKAVVLDLRELEFMDSSGVRVLIAAHAKASEAAGRLTLVRPARGSAVDRILEISGVDEALGMVDEA